MLPCLMFPLLKQIARVNNFRALSTATESANKDLIKYGEYLVSCLPKYIEKVAISRGNELNVHVPVGGLLATLEFLRDHNRCQYKQLMDLTAVDWLKSSTVTSLNEKGRFELIYCLLSIQHNSRLVLHTFAESSTHPSVPSVTSLFPSANWSEREAFDLYGVIFEGHPDLRRIMTDYGFEGHPLRKDFPLTGFVEVRYDEEIKRVIEEPLELTQEFRKFEYSSPVSLKMRIISILNHSNNLFYLFSGNKFPRRRKLNLNLRKNKVFLTFPIKNNKTRRLINLLTDTKNYKSHILSLCPLVTPLLIR